MPEFILKLLGAVRVPGQAHPIVDPILDEFLPALDRGTEPADWENALNRASEQTSAQSAERDADQLAAFWASDADTCRRVCSTLLDGQDDLRFRVERVADAAAADESVLAQETLRRLLVELCPAPFGLSSLTQLGDPDVTQASVQFLTSAAVRLTLLTLALQHAAQHGTTRKVLYLAHKAFETSQTLRGAASAFAFDLTPWFDVPTVRVRRIMESGSRFWGSLAPEQQAAVEEAWSEKVELPARC